MSIIITGDGVSRGICIGQAIVVYKDNIDHSASFVSKNQVSKESKKCLDVIKKLKTEYKKSSSKIKNNPAIPITCSIALGSSLALFKITPAINHINVIPNVMK